MGSDARGWSYALIAVDDVGFDGHTLASGRKRWPTRKEAVDAAQGQARRAKLSVIGKRARQIGPTDRPPSRRAPAGTMPTGAYPVALRLTAGTPDALRLDRLAARYGGRSAALRAGLLALERIADAEDQAKAAAGGDAS